MLTRSKLWPVMIPLMLALGGCSAALPEPDYADLAYATLSPAQRLDIYLPEGDGPFPLVINIHGGGFRMGDKDMLDAPIAEALLAKGVAVASIDWFGPSDFAQMDAQAREQGCPPDHGAAAPVTRRPNPDDSTP